MLIGKIGKAFEASSLYPAIDLSKHSRQDQEEHQGDDRREHRGLSRGAGGNGFSGSLLARSCWHLIGSHLHRKLAAKASAKVGDKVPANA